jgi:hypothetical protein
MKRLKGKMEMRKMDEMEKDHSGKAARLAFSYYTLVLLIWSLVDWFKTKSTGIEFPILMIGCAIYAGVQVYLLRKTK